MLALIGLGGFAVKVAADNHNKTAATQYNALGAQKADAKAKALDARVKQVKAAYDDYAAAAATVRTRHEAVTNQFNDVVTPLNPTDLLGIADAREKVPKVIAAYAAAVKQEAAARQAYLEQLALLKKQVAR